MGTRFTKTKSTTSKENTDPVHKVVFLSTYNAGKSTILSHLGASQRVSKLPMIRFTVDDAEFQGMVEENWDFGGRMPMRIPPRAFYRNAAGIIFIMDSSDREVEYAVDTLRRTLTQEELSGVPLLVIANKSDLPNAMSADYIEKSMNLSALVGATRSYCVQSVSALHDKGQLLTAMRWLKDAMAGQALPILPTATATEGHGSDKQEVVEAVAHIVLPAAA